MRHDILNNPHDWRKFEQAQRNMLRTLNMTRKVGGHSAWNGANWPNKRLRRINYWTRQMGRWLREE